MFAEGPLCAQLRKGQAQPHLAPQPVEKTVMWGRWGLTQLHKHFSEKRWGALGRGPWQPHLYLQ